METLKVWFAASLGAGIGALIALQFNIGIFLGIIPGFAVGYLTYGFRQVITGGKTAWRETKARSIAVIGWRPNYESWSAGWAAYSSQVKTFLMVCRCCGIFSLNIGISAYLFGKWFERYVPHDPVFNGPESIFHISIGLFVFTWIAGIATVSAIPDEKAAEILARHIGRLHPFRFFFVKVPRAIGWLLWGCIRLIGAGIVLALVGPLMLSITILFLGSSLVWEFFKAIHSEIRLLCGVDAAIGAAIGYHYHSVILGIIIGGVWAVINFELLSIRLFKFVPVERSLLHPR